MTNQYKIENGRYSLSIGYNRHISSFFGILVEIPSAGSGDDCKILAWVGSASEPCHTAEHLADELKPWTILPKEVVDHLTAAATEVQYRDEMERTGGRLN